MAIDLNQAQQDYSAGTSANAEKLVRNYTKRSGKLDAAKSDAAETLYAAKVQAAIANKSRQKGLNKTSEGDMNAAMQASGASNYRTGTQRSAGKWGKNFQPYASTLDGLEGKLPAKTADPIANVTNRVGAVVRAMVETKKRIG